MATPASSLFGPTEGWSLEPVATWMLTEGRRITDAAQLVTQLMARLDAAGARIDRLRFSSTTLHPQLAAWGLFWNRRDGAQPWNGAHGVQFSDAYIGSPIQYVREHAQPFRFRVGATEEEGEHALLLDLRHEGMTDYIALPLVFYYLIKLTNDRKLMGEYTNNRFQKWFAVICTVVIVITSVATVISSFLS